MTPVRRRLATTWQFLRELSGETAYDNYLNHHRRAHPGDPPMTRREFEKRTTNPKVRCC